MDSYKLKILLLDLLENDEDVQRAVKEAFDCEKDREEWREARAWT